MGVSVTAAWALVGVRGKVAIAPDHPAEVAAAVVERVGGWRSELSGAQQLVIDRQMRPTPATLFVPATCFQPRLVRKRWSPLVTSSVPSSNVTRYAFLRVSQ